MLGLGVDGWATWDIRANDVALLEFYGATDIIGEDRTNLYECECTCWMCAVLFISMTHGQLVLAAASQHNSGMCSCMP